MAYIEIGGAPHEEPCAAIGKHDEAFEWNRLECRAYIAALRIKYGPEPAGTHLRLRLNQHDFGTYAEVCCNFFDDAAAIEYANKVEHGVATWHEVGMWPPVTYDDAGRAVRLLRRSELWLRERNPECRDDVADLPVMPPPPAPAT